MVANRQRLVAVVVILVVSVPLVVLATSSGGDSGDGSGRNALRVELAPIPPPNGEVIIYIRDERDNTPEGADGRTAVSLECLDRKDKVVLRQSYPWPMERVGGESFGPHIHQPLPQGGLRKVVSCRLAGTKGPLEGRAKPAEL